jgi:hypothetical protein
MLWQLTSAPVWAGSQVGGTPRWLPVTGRSHTGMTVMDRMPDSCTKTLLLSYLKLVSCTWEIVCMYIQCVPNVMVGFQNIISIKRNILHTSNMN